MLIPLSCQVSWIGSADMPLAHIIKIEDARTGQWLRHLDPVTDPVKRIDMGWTMGDWNQLDVGVETVALREYFQVLIEHIQILPCLCIPLDNFDSSCKPVCWFSGPISPSIRISIIPKRYDTLHLLPYHSSST